ncbi:hypothetical protein G9272_27090 [Streptomyces asoensis]|uniref:CU044_5270 family protein n=1 Tax=Streptomyces asoensis TaxID=249586 RepID=A0A6M4WSH3_9ACTN|nr:hypothetical protein [Streptomyces asoensis]QJT03490.1 hypothetical protein G9272_27090 [Streptomyces asoensis]
MAEPAMDEMTAVRQLRADAPVPDHARLTPARRRLLDEIEGRPRRGYGGWQLRALGAVAAVLAAALLSTLTLWGDHHATPTKPAAPPGAHQWVYLESRYDTWHCRTNLGPQGYGEVGAFYMDPGPEPCTEEPARSTDDEGWTRYDGGRQADGNASGTDAVHEWGGTNANYLSPQATDALVADLPDDPDAALRLILERSVPDRATYKVRLTQAQRDFDEVVEVLSGATAVPSDKARVIHRVIMSLAEATEAAGATDGAGRKVLAIGVDGNFRDYAWERNSMQVLLDPETFAYRGVRWVAGMDYYVGGKASGGPLVTKGTVIATATRVATVVVDKAGDRN